MANPPLFLISTPRSGSTLLQRIINTSDQVRLSGESDGFISNLAKTWSKINKHVASNGLNNTWDIVTSDTKKFPAWWQAPGLEQQCAILKDFIQSFYQNRAGLRWGFKEVRLCKNAEDGVLELDFLKSLFPNADFIFLTRPIQQIQKSMIKRPDWWTTEEICSVSTQNPTITSFGEKYSSFLNFTDLSDFAKLRDFLNNKGVKISEGAYDKAIKLNLS